MLMPSIFGENLFDDDWMDFPFDRFDREFWGKKNPLYGKNAKNMMKTDIREHDAGYELDIDLPGFKKDEINVDLENGYLTISAAKGLDKDEQNKKGKYIRRERYAGAMQRSFYVGAETEHPEEGSAGRRDKEAHCDRRISPVHRKSQNIFFSIIIIEEIKRESDA